MHENDYTLYDYIKPILTGSIISILLSGVLLFILSLVLTKIDIPFSLITPISVVILGFSTLIGSFIGAKKFGRKGLFIGLCTSLVIYLTLLLLNLSIEPQGFGTIAIIKAVVILATGIAGGVFGVNKKNHARFKI